MTSTTLHGANPSEHGGAYTTPDFGDARAEFHALLSGCGLYDLSGRAKIAVTGSDRVRWLNGMATNNVRDLASGHGVYAFLLNAQGRIQADMYVYNRDDHFLADTDAAQFEKMCGTFEKFIIMDDVELAAVADVTAIGVRGPKAREVFQRANISFAELMPLQLQNTISAGIGMSIVRARQADAYELWISTANVAAIWNELAQAGATRVGSEAVDLRRIADGEPRYGVDIRDRDLPQETGQVGALNFNKGCYVGQEIVERIHSRGQVHRQFSGFLFAGEGVAPGAKISANGKDIGEITSFATLPSANGKPARKVALGYIRREAAEVGFKVEAEGATATVAKLPFE